VIEPIGEMWEEQKLGVCKVLINQMGSAFNLLDLEWKFGVTVGNKLIDSKGECFVQIKLVVQDPEMKINEIFMELTPVQFYDLYGELEKIKSIMEVNG
jgi:COMM domain